jgi:hypothetical protein
VRVAIVMLVRVNNYSEIIDDQTNYADRANAP